MGHYMSGVHKPCSSSPTMWGCLWDEGNSKGSSWRCLWEGRRCFFGLAHPGTDCRSCLSLLGWKWSVEVVKYDGV